MNVFQITTDLESRGMVDRTEFGGENNFLPFPGQSLAEKGFVGAGRVGVRRIEEGHAELDRPVHGSRGFGFVGFLIEFGQGHAAETDGGDLDVGGT